MTRAKRHGITRQHADALREIAAWLRQQPDATPLEIGVIEEVTERVTAYAHTAALVRIRVKNLGTPPSERARVAKRVARRNRTFGRPWTPEDKDLLTRLFHQGLQDLLIAEQLERTECAVQFERLTLNLTRERLPRVIPEDPARRGIWGNPDARGRQETPLQRARKVMAQRKQREAAERREGAA